MVYYYYYYYGVYIYVIYRVIQHNTICRVLVGVSRMDRVRNEEARRRAGIERELASGADQRVMRWFGHLEIMDEHRMARRVLMAEVSGERIRVRPRWA